jgi:Peptide chain release factor 1 (eRF1)
MLHFLDELEAAADMAKSLYLPPGLSHSEIEDLLGEVLDTQDIPADMAALAVSSGTGAVIFWGPSRKCLILPPFPIRGKYFADGYAVEPLRALLRHDFSVALILVRLGSYAVGLCQGEKLISSKVGTGLVHGRHKKGGSSQQRFQRHREKQIESFLTRVCSHIREKLEPQARTLDYLVYGGAWTTILSLQKRCSLLQQFENRTLAPLLDIPEPRQMVLETAVGRVWSSKIVEWYDDEAPT